MPKPLVHSPFEKLVAIVTHRTRNHDEAAIIGYIETYSEYVVVLYNQRKCEWVTTYYTDNEDDAFSTARHMIEGDFANVLDNQL